MVGLSFWGDRDGGAEGGGAEWRYFSGAELTNCEVKYTMWPGPGLRFIGTDEGQPKLCRKSKWTSDTCGRQMTDVEVSGHGSQMGHIHQISSHYVHEVLRINKRPFVQPWGWRGEKGAASSPTVLQRRGPSFCCDSRSQRMTSALENTVTLTGKLP